MGLCLYMSQHFHMKTDKVTYLWRSIGVGIFFYFTLMGYQKINFKNLTSKWGWIHIPVMPRLLKAITIKRFLKTVFHHLGSRKPTVLYKRFAWSRELATLLERVHCSCFEVNFQKIILFYLRVILCFKVGDNGSIQFQMIYCSKLFVVYFDQQPGAPHTVHCLESFF